MMEGRTAGEDAVPVADRTRTWSAIWTGAKRRTGPARRHESAPGEAAPDRRSERPANAPERRLGDVPNDEPERAPKPARDRSGTGGLHLTTAIECRPIIGGRVLFAAFVMLGAGAIALWLPQERAALQAAA